jgi:formylglycine-generating enzyme required for sulfatase activity
MLVAAIMILPLPAAHGWAAAESVERETRSASCCMPSGSAARIGMVRTAATAAPVTGREAPPAGEAPSGMVWIPGGEFEMGSLDPLSRRDESPIHRVRVDGFWMDATEVTNAQFRAFVEATGYVTVAERPDDWEELKKHLPPGTPRPSDEAFLPGSLVFTPPDHPVPLQDATQWWSWTPGADWRHPEGPGSDLAGRDDHPVVHIAYEDAMAYCAWAGKRLPTEAEWERAARGGLESKVNVWGDEPVDPTRCNIWTGRFPDKNTTVDGFAGTAPVRSFPPNAFGLYDMAGNVWEWCSDLYHPETYSMRVGQNDPNQAIPDPKGPERSFDPRSPYEPELRVIRGGSFLCNDSYCASYRPSARMSTSPDTGLAHTGFRCVLDPDSAQNKLSPESSSMEAP